VLLKQCIKIPRNLPDALQKIEVLEEYVMAIFKKAPDKRKAPNPRSIGYFLSYFWQIHNHKEWPVMYSSLIESFADLGLWQASSSQNEAYSEFYQLNEEIKQILSAHKGSPVLNWEAEHAFWSLKRRTPDVKIEPTPTSAIQPEPIKETQVSALAEASFDIYDYLPRLVTNLIELGADRESTGSAKGSKYEKAVCEVFKLLGFTIESLGQGSGREPDLIAIHKEDNVAFIVDAKAYAQGYMLNAADDRAIREYINYYCPKLKREGIQRIGFIIVSNSFKAAFDDFSNDITWRTDIKRFILLRSDALLHLLAYRNKDQKSLSEIVEVMISFGPVISAQDIIQQFDDI
jgi:hypothetical protein